MRQLIKICMISLFFLSVLLFTGCIKPTFQLVIHITPSGAGDVIGEGVYKKGDTVVLEAISAEGYRFLHWKKGESILTDKNPYSFEISESLNLEAVFSVDFGEISVSDTDLVLGEEGYVKVSGVKLGAVDFIEVVVKFDPNVLTWESSSCRIPDWLIIEKNPSPGIVHVAITGSSIVIDGIREFLRLYFLPKQTGISEVGFTNYTSEGGVFFETNYITPDDSRKTYPELMLKNGVVIVDEN